MIKFSKIDEELNVYKNAGKIVLFGTGSAGQRLFNILKYFGIEADLFSDNNEKKWNKTVWGKKIIPPSELESMCKADGNILVQVASTYSSAITTQLDKAGVNNYIDYFEAKARLEYIRAVKRSKNIEYVESFLANEYVRLKGEDFKKVYYDGLIAAPADTIHILCQPMKTGAHTISSSFGRYGIPLVSAMHRPELINLHSLENMGYNKIKIITTVREPISQNLSAVFQALSNGEMAFQFIAKANSCPYGDVQLAFESVVEAKGYFDFKKNRNVIGRKIMSGTLHAFLIQDFLKKFNSEVFDLYSIPFDKERGYSIKKTENIEILVFQLEKLNEISEELFKWAGCPGAALVKSNLASEKWIAEAYERAKREIRFPREYFDKCYNEPYVRHFYSDEDIEKFKAKWEKNIL